MVLFLRSKKGFRYIPENESEQDILGWNKSDQPVRDPKSTSPKRVERPESIIVQDALIPPSEKRDKEFDMEDLPAIDKYTSPSEGYSTTPLP